MKIIAVLVLLTLVIPVNVLAQQGEQKGTGPEAERVQPKPISIDIEGEDVVTQGQGQTKGIHEPGTGIENPELKEQGQGTGQGLVEGEVNKEGQIQEGTLGTEKMKKKAEQRGSERSIDRRSQVANSVQEMLKVAERNAGIGQQIRTVAQTQNQIQEQAEEAIQEAQKRSKFTKFLIGPNYGRLKQVEEGLGINTEQLKELKELKNQVENSEDVAILEQEIFKMEQIRTDLELEVKNEKKGFSLFGWMNRLFSK